MKQRLRQLLKRRDNDAIAVLAGRKRRVLGTLISLTFDPDPLIGWRAVEALGAASEHLARNDPECVRDCLRRLHWLLSEESGGICWRSPEAMAEIVRRTPALASDYVPIIVGLIQEMAEEDLAHFRVGILWAIGRLGPVAGKQLDAALPTIVGCLDHADAQVRGLAVWCLGNVAQTALLAGRRDLLEDAATVDLYDDGALSRTSVCSLVRRALCD